MGRKIVLSGQQFGDWLVTASWRRERKCTEWLCRCRCGVEAWVQHGNLQSGRSTRCQACAARFVGTKNRTHGKTSSAEFAAWMHLRKKHKAVLCVTWRDSFEDFYAAVGVRPSPTHELGRINKSIEYQPGNTVWLSAMDAANDRVSTRAVTFNGRTQSLQLWCRELGVPYKRTYARLLEGWSITEVLDTNFYGATHRASKTPEYMIWKNMKGRCTNPRNGMYKHYGGRGIKVCDRWLTSFENFLADMGVRPTNKHQLDRTGNNGNYEPGNCRWVTAVQNINNRRITKLVTFNNKTMSVAAWAVEIGVKYQTLRMRFELGWTVEKALTTKSIR